MRLFQSLPVVLHTVLLLSLSFGADAHTLNTAAAHLKINRVDLLWRVNADATSVYEQSMEREALSDQGAQMSTKHAQMYNKALQRFEVLEAYTLKPDGRKISVGKDAMQVQSGIASGSTGPSWPEAEIMQITFPEVQKGDRTGWRLRITQHTTPLPGWASIQEYLPPLIEYERVTARIEAPQSVGLQVFASGLSLRQSMDGTTSMWEAEGSGDARVIDSQPLNLLGNSPRLLASTYKSSEQLAAAYAREANVKAVVSDDIRTLALKITEGKDAPREKATAIHDWVRKNIRYVAVYLGAGGWVPHDLAWILKNGYGDCKDHVLLMQTLLKAVNIEAVPVLINSDNEYERPELPVSFNHVIVYIPSLDVFADPTDSRIPFGALPWSAAGKPVTVALSQSAKEMHTPVFTPDTNRIVVKTKLRIDKNGKGTGSVEAEATGMAATTLQDILAQFPTGMNDVAVQKILEFDHWRGRGTAEFDPVQRNVQKQNFKITNLELDNLLNDPSGGSVNPHPKLMLPIYIHRHFPNFSAPVREFPTPCTPIFIREVSILEFDPEYSVIKIPKAMAGGNQNSLNYKAEYKTSAKSVQSEREFKITHGSHLCTVSQYSKHQPEAANILANLRSGVAFIKN